MLRNSSRRSAGQKVGSSPEPRTTHKGRDRHCIASHSVFLPRVLTALPRTASRVPPPASRHFASMTSSANHEQTETAEIADSVMLGEVYQLRDDLEGLTPDESGLTSSAKVAEAMEKCDKVLKLVNLAKDLYNKRNAFGREDITEDEFRRGVRFCEGMRACDRRETVVLRNQQRGLCCAQPAEIRIAASFVFVFSVLVHAIPLSCSPTYT